MNVLKSKIQFEFANVKSPKVSKPVYSAKEIRPQCEVFAIHAICQKRSSHYSRELWGPDNTWPYKWVSGVITKWSYGPLLMRLPAAIQQHMAAVTTCLPARVRIVRLLSDSSPHAKLHLLAPLLYSSHSCLHFFDP